jgi:secreted trypsin-like serine protease
MARSKWAAAGVVLACCLSACVGGGGGDDEEAMLTDPEQRCGGIGVRPYVANGTACVPSASTPVVLLQVVSRNGDVGTCTGVKVAPGRVLTAAHCVESGVRAVLAVVWDTGGQASAVQASSWVRAPSFRRSDTYYIDDVAVVAFGQALPVPAAPVLGQDPRAGQAILIAGWGEPGHTLTVGSAVLDRVTSDFLRIAYDGTLSNACPGDSGGPALRVVGARQAVGGLVSTGSLHCGVGGYTYFTNLSKSAVLEFIRREVPGVEIL